MQNQVVGRDLTVFWPDGVIGHFSRLSASAGAEKC